MKKILYIGWDKPTARLLEDSEPVKLAGLEQVEFNTEAERQAYIDGATSANGWDSPHWVFGETVSIVDDTLIFLEDVAPVVEPAAEVSLYPELDKMHAVQPNSQIIGEFLEAMAEKGINLCEAKKEGNNGLPPYIFEETGEEATLADVMNHKAIYNPDYQSWSAGNYYLNTSTENLLAEYFGIDLNKAEKEKRALLDSLRN